MITLPRSQAHGIANGDINKWSKVLLGRHEFFKISLRRENEAMDTKLGTDAQAKDKLQEFMMDYAEELHRMMRDDTLMPWTLV